MTTVSSAGHRGPLPTKWRWTSWPRRTLWPTRDGWWCLAAAIGLGFAAMNTGNNLLYLLVSMLLGLIIVSGILSEQSIRHLHFVAIHPDEMYAGRAALLGVRVQNQRRWRASYSIMIDVVDDAERPSQQAYLTRLPPGAEQLVTWESVLPARGVHPFPRVRISTRFPFGLFLKAGYVRLDATLIVYPAVRPIDPSLRHAADGGTTAMRRRGRGADLYNLREYRAGDDPRMIHWKSSAKTGTLVVRELQADTAVDARIVLDGKGADARRLEAGLSDAASLASRLLGEGAGVELAAPCAYVPLGYGRQHRRRVLTALALYDPTIAPSSSATAPANSAIREIRVSIG